MNRKALISVLVIGAVAFGVFWAFPNLDTGPSAYFYIEGYGFWLSQDALINRLQGSVRWIAIGIGIVLILMLAWSWIPAGMWARRRRRTLAYLLAVLLIGPGLVTNTILKDGFGRPRPGHTLEFGGDKTYVPPGMISDQCARNCSFTSGDSTLGFYLIAFAFAFPRRRKAWVTTALSLGSALGLLRIAMGGHYISDVVFAGVTVTIVAAVLSMAMLGGHRACGMNHDEHR